MAGRFAGSHIPDPGFAGDEGSVPASVAAALQAFAQDRSRRPEALGAVQADRLLVPVVAVLGEVEHDEQGLAHDKSSDMATVLVRGADGRLALLAFTGSEPLARWNPEARPVPVTARDAARAALAEGAEALVVDIAGPVPLAVEGDDLRGFAEGWTLARVGDRTAWVRQDPDSAHPGKIR